MLPLKDDQPSYSTPYVNWFLIGLNILIFLFQATLDPRSSKLLAEQFGEVPSHLAAFVAGSHRYTLPQVVLPFFTSMFLHGGWAHVGGFVAGMLMIKLFPERSRRSPYAYS